MRYFGLAALLVIVPSLALATSNQTMTQIYNNRLRVITNNTPVADFGSDYIVLSKPLAVQPTPVYSNEATSKIYVDQQVAALKNQIALLQVQVNLFNRSTSAVNTNNTVAAMASIPNTLTASVASQ